MDLKRPVLTEKQLLESDAAFGPFWFCSSGKEKVSVKCQDLGVNRLEDPKAELYIKIEGQDILHEYGLRHGIALDECIDMRTQMKEALKRDKKFCLLGLRAGDVKFLADGRQLVDWVFFKFKSKKISFCDFCD